MNVCLCAGAHVGAGSRMQQLPTVFWGTTDFFYFIYQFIIIIIIVIVIVIIISGEEVWSLLPSSRPAPAQSLVYCELKDNGLRVRMFFKGFIRCSML